MQGGANVQDARREMTKTKEQLEEEKKISLSIRIKPLDVDAMDSDQLGAKAKELWDTIVRLETEKYDLEERQKRQDYDVSILTSFSVLKNNFCKYQTKLSIISTVVLFTCYNEISYSNQFYLKSFFWKIVWLWILFIVWIKRIYFSFFSLSFPITYINS